MPLTRGGAPGIGPGTGGVSRRTVELSVLLALPALLGLPLLAGEVLAGHDVRSFLLYAQQSLANLRDGVVLPAWAPDANLGYGGPGLLFYPPLVKAWLHELPGLLGLPLATGMSLLAVVGLFVSGVTAFAWLRAEGAGNGALAGAVVYVGAPYRLLTLYERTALAEHWAFVFPPLVLWLARRDDVPPARRAALAALAVGGLLLTNLPMGVFFGLALGAWFLHPAGPSRATGRVPLAIGAGLGLLLAAFSLLPQGLSERWVESGLWFGPLARAGLRSSENLLFSGGGIDPAFNRTASTVVVATLLLLVAAFAAGGRATWRDRGARLWLAVGAGAFLAALPGTGRLWDAVPVLAQMQFPWRLGAPMTLALAAVVALSARTRALAGIAVALLALLASLPLVGRSTVPAEALPSAPPAGAFPGQAPDPVALLETSALAPNPWLRNPRLEDGWYVPKAVRPRLAAEVWGDAPPAYPALRRAPAVLREDPSAPVEVVDGGGLGRTVRVRAARPGLLVLRAIDFPGWRVAVDGREVAASRDAATGLLAVPLEPGLRTVAWGWEPFPLLRAGRVVSLLALLLVVALLAAPRRTAREAPRP